MSTRQMRLFRSFGEAFFEKSVGEAHAVQAGIFGTQLDVAAKSGACNSAELLVNGSKATSFEQNIGRIQRTTATLGGITSAIEGKLGYIALGYIKFILEAQQHSLRATIIYWRLVEKLLGLDTFVIFHCR